MKVMLLFLLLTIGSSAMAREFTVGRAQIEIPAPNGFVRSTPEMAKLEQFQKSFVPPTNEQLAFYFSEADAPAALAGNLPELTRRFSVQIGKAGIDSAVSLEQFTALKSFIRTQGEEGFAKAKEKADFSPGSAALSRAFDTDVVIKAGGIVPMAPHEESDHSLSLSTAMVIDVQTEGANDPIVVIGTFTVVLVRDKILNLYVYGGPEDLEWTRAKSKEWVDAIISANSTAVQDSGTAGPSSGGATPATRFLSRGLGGALSAFLVMLLLAGIASVFSARKKG